jgi:hypothetical protein
VPFNVWLLLARRAEADPEVVDPNRQLMIRVGLQSHALLRGTTIAPTKKKPSAHAAREQSTLRRPLRVEDLLERRERREQRVPAQVHEQLRRDLGMKTETGVTYSQIR